MKKLLLLLPLVLSTAACFHRVPQSCPDPDPNLVLPKEIPAGALVQFTVRDQKGSYRFSTFLVDASKGEVLARRDGSKPEELAQVLSQSLTSTGAQDTTSAQQKQFFPVPSSTVFVKCSDDPTATGCFSLGAGDPPPTGGGGPGVAGHEEYSFIVKYAALQARVNLAIGAKLPTRANLPVQQPRTHQ